MKTSKFLKIIGPVAVFLFIGEAWANTGSDFSKYLDRVVTQVETSLVNLDSSASSETSQFVLQDLNLDFSPTVGLGIDDVLSISVTPEIDLVLVPAV